MSIKVMTYVWEHSQHKGSELLTLLAIADFAHDDGTQAYPSIATLKDKTRMSERSMQLILRKLEASNEVVIERNAGPKGCHLFTVRIDRGNKMKTGRGAKIAPEGAKIAGGAESGRGGVQNRVLLQPQIAPDPSLDPSEDPSGRKRSSLTTFESTADMGEMPLPAPATVHTKGVALAVKSTKAQRPILDADDWVYRVLLDYDDVVNVEALNDAGWWVDVAKPIAAIWGQSWLEVELSKMATYFVEHPRKRPATNWKQFVRGWLHRAYEWERKHNGRTSAPRPQRS